MFYGDRWYNKLAFETVPCLYFIHEARVKFEYKYEYTFFKLLNNSVL